MELDPAPAASASQQRPARRVTVPADSPYELDSLASTWDVTGRGKPLRLLHVAQSSPSLAGPALTLALSSIKSLTLDVRLYEETFHAYRKFVSSIDAGEEQDPRAVEWLKGVRGEGGRGEEKVDREWVERTRREAQGGQDKLEVELKGYLTNLIKESIRMGHRDLALHQALTGDLQSSVRSFSKSREYCTTSSHVLDMCLGVIAVALDLSNYAFVRNYVVKAESAVEAAAASASNAGKSKAAAAVNLPGMVAPAQDPVEAQKERERRIVLERLAVAGGVAHLGSGQFEKAARAFTEVGSEALVSGPAHFIPPADIALYAVLTSLATFSRAQLRTRILENASLRPFLDLEPWLREAVRLFQGGRYSEGFAVLKKHEARMLLDIHLAPHYPTLLHSLSHLSLLTFLAPFSSVTLSRTASSFGWSEPAVLAAVVELIRAGRLKARVDVVGGKVVQRRRDERGEAFRSALTEGERARKKVGAAQLRMKLLAAELVVKPGKGGAAGAGGGGGGGKGGKSVRLPAGAEGGEGEEVLDA
ncbi:hypothetical protein JCM6882_001691 [Rhodosporidiobolus microsporus]